jgi:hypothetical protein
LRAADAPAETAVGTAHQIVDWGGGTLDDLVSLLSGPAWSARVEVLSQNGGDTIGEVHVIAGGVSEAIFESKSTHDALDKLRAVKSTRFRVEPRLPNPSDGDLTFPGPEQGKLEERPLAHLMRYCEDYVLTAGIEVWRGSESSKVDYRRGDIVGVTVGGIDAPERLAEVMKWSSGSYRLIVPKLTLPETAPKAAPPATVVAPRSAAAASKTIFGMPALDPTALAAATEKIKALQNQLPGLPGKTPAGAAVPAPTVPRPSSPVAPGMVAPHAGSAVPPTTTATAPASAPTAAATPTAAAPTVPRQSAPAAKTIIGVQPAPAAATAPSSTPTNAGQGAAPAVEARAATAAAPTAESAKPGKQAVAQPSPTALKPAHAAAATTTATAEIDRTIPTKAPKQKPNETPVWTYVGVGFIFGLALLGVYRLVIVLAH